MIVDSYAHYVKEVGHHFHGNCSHGDIGYEFGGNINIERVIFCPLLGVILERGWLRGRGSGHCALRRYYVTNTPSHTSSLSHTHPHTLTSSNTINKWEKWTCSLVTFDLLFTHVVGIPTS